MKTLKNITLYLCAILFFASCIKNEPKIFTGSVIEFDATVLNAPAVGKTFPILTRVPGYGRPVFTSSPADPLITRSSGNIKFRVNLVGAQRSTDQTLSYRVVPAESTATSGVHFTTSGTFTIPANSSFGEITVNVVNPGTSSSTPVILVLELVGNSDLQPSQNFKFLGMSISQL
ncbi:MAG TPA: DUF4843 domain-containing protein [Lacibacter sp.]|nr:DUF4843 domain-containing protein [Lacibacter sp.]